jgi:hypothetical protein
MLTQSDGRAIVDAGRDLEVDVLALGFGAFAAADAAEFLRNLAGAMTFRADASLLDVAEDSAGDGDDLALAFTGFTRLEFITRFDGRPLTVLTGILEVQVQLDFGAENGLFEIDLNPRLDVPAAALALLLVTHTAAEETAEDVAQAHITEVEALALTEAIKAFEAAAITPDTGVSELVVALALLGIFQYFVRFANFLEFSFITTLVRVVSHRRSAEGLLYLIR